MSVRYIGQKLAQQVSPAVLRIRGVTDQQIDEELMSASGAFSLDQVGRPIPSTREYTNAIVNGARRSSMCSSIPQDFSPYLSP